jgi:hypothetical protein
MDVERKKWYHKLFRPLLNAVGTLKGISGCLICGDKWNWKMTHTVAYSWSDPSRQRQRASEEIAIAGAGIDGNVSIRIGHANHAAAFPTCEECWQTKSTREITGAAYALSRLWMKQCSTTYLAENKARADAMFDAVIVAANARVS